MLLYNSMPRSRIRSRKRLTLEEHAKQSGGSPAYRMHASDGMLSGKSFVHEEIPLTTYENGFSDHIVHTSGGGGKSNKKPTTNTKTKAKAKTNVTLPAYNNTAPSYAIDRIKPKLSKINSINSKITNKSIIKNKSISKNNKK
jgi:hypothetical protein